MGLGPEVEQCIGLGIVGIGLGPPVEQGLGISPGQNKEPPPALVFIFP